MKYVSVLILVSLNASATTVHINRTGPTTKCGMLDISDRIAEVVRYKGCEIAESEADINLDYSCSPEILHSGKSVDVATLTLSEMDSNRIIFKGHKKNRIRTVEFPAKFLQMISTNLICD